jgi:NAD-reducing hydrogenase small subunit
VKKMKLATVWLDGCSGCHMSLLDMDARIVAVVGKADLVYGPLVDAQVFPEEVDVTLVEGAVSTSDDIAKIQKIRQSTRTLVALGDCAVTGNVPAMRNTIAVTQLLQDIYPDGVPNSRVPPLAAQARPLHDFVKVDIHVPGCPPSAEVIFGLVNDLLEGRKPEPVAKLRFG